MGMIPDEARPILAPKARAKWDNIRQKHMILFPEGLLLLNETAQEVIAMCNGQHKFINIVKSLNDKYKTQDVDTDVRLLLRKLMEKRLLLLK